MAVILKFRPRKPQPLPARPPAPSMAAIYRAHLIAAVCFYAVPVMMLLEFFQYGNAPREIQPEERNYD